MRPQWHAAHVASLTHLRLQTLARVTCALRRALPTARAAAGVSAEPVRVNAPSQNHARWKSLAGLSRTILHEQEFVVVGRRRRSRFIQCYCAEQAGFAPATFGFEDESRRARTR